MSFLLLLTENFVGYKILGFFFFFYTLNISPHSLACMVSEELSDVILSFSSIGEVPFLVSVKVFYLLFEFLQFKYDMPRCRFFFKFSCLMVSELLGIFHLVYV